MLNSVFVVAIKELKHQDWEGTMVAGTVAKLLLISHHYVKVRFQNEVQ